METYDLHSKFNAEKHKQTYINYLEIIMHKDGRIEYAVPSHQEKLIEIACEQEHCTREELYAKCPPEMSFDVVEWLCRLTGCISIWTDHFVRHWSQTLTDAQYDKLKELKQLGIYHGDVYKFRMSSLD